jgi:serine/threonine-protein kinase
MSLRAQLDTHLESTYTIERELGGGGMSRVFLATDRALGRRVVIKVLSPTLAAEVSAKRFEREIRLAAALQHANIVPLLSAGVADDLPYYTMPFVDGASLRERLKAGERVPLAEAIGILRDVARALAYAHDQGVVHRDIKPENVLLAGDAAVVTDFGIAKALAAAKRTSGADDRDEPARATALTGTGVSVGTPAYMAPEQITGDPAIDHRADLYAFGCLAYETLSGKQPFEGSAPHALLAAHISARPIPLGERCPDCPPAITRFVMCCLEKDPAARPQSAREVLRVLEGSQERASGFTRLRQGLTRRQRVGLVGGALLFLAAVAALATRQWLAGRTVSVAVIPFLNVSGDTADDYLADGIADGLATGIGKASGVRVVARSLAYQFRGRRGIDPRDVGRRLAARQVVQGSMRRVGELIHVSAQLTSAEDNSETWSASYDRPAGDVIAVQEEIARAIVDTLQRRFGGVKSTSVANSSSGTSNRDAYDLYMRGRFLLLRRGPGVRQSIDKFEQAIALDSNFARAHAALAFALELLPYFEFKAVNVDSLNTRAMRHVDRALALDSTIAETHIALALRHQHRYEWKLADESYRRALALGPEEVDVQIQYGRFLFYTRTIAEALPHFERARALDPLSAVASGWVGHLLDLSGRHAEGMKELRHALEADSTNPPALVFMADALRDAGHPQEARAYTERLRGSWPQWGDAGISKPIAYANQRDTARMFAAFQQETDARMIWPTYFSLHEPAFDFVRRTKHFAEVVRGVSLDVRIFTVLTREGKP